MRNFIQKALRHSYFPEVWYLIENWLTSVSGRNVAEIGCGKGLFSKALAKSGWRLTCLDPATRSLRRTAKFLAHSQLQADYLQGEPEKLPLVNEQFDAVVSVNLLEFADNPQAALEEAFRVLKPGGKAVIVVFRRFTFWALRAVAEELRKNDRSRNFTAFSRREFRELLANSGFIVYSLKIKARFLPFQFGTSSIPLPFGGTMIALLEKPDPNQAPKQLRFEGNFHKD